MVQSHCKNLVAEHILKLPRMQEAARVVQQVSEGGKWLVGSAVYKSAVSVIHRRPVVVPKDFDFLVESLSDCSRRLISGWERHRNRFGNPRLTRGRAVIDVIPIGSVRSILRKRRPPTVASYLRSVPFTIQALCYNVQSGRILGRLGWDAVLKQRIGVQDRAEALAMALRRKRSVAELEDGLAATLGFPPRKHLRSA